MTLSTIVTKENGSTTENQSSSSTSEERSCKASKDDDSQSTEDSSVCAGISSPHGHDVLCGRGVTTNRHKGNENFRELVDEKKVRLRIENKSLLPMYLFPATKC